MDIDAEGVRNLSDPLVWLKYPHVGRDYVRSMYGRLILSAPEEHRAAIREHLQAMERLRTKLKLDEASKKEALLFNQSLDYLQQWEKRLQHGGARPKLGEAVSFEQKVEMARIAGLPEIARLALRLAETSKGHGRQWTNQVPRWEEFSALPASTREVVAKLPPHIAELKHVDCKPAKLAAFIAQFLCGLPVDLNANLWFSPGHAVKLVREGRRA